MESEHKNTQQSSLNPVPPAVQQRMDSVTGPQSRGPVYLNSLNYFRGLAILFIVAGHAFTLAGWHTDAAYEKVIVNLVKGGTAFFVFISGFLFHHIFSRNFNYRRFMSKKIGNVLMPYLVVCTPLVIYYVGIRQGGPHADLMYTAGTGVVADYLLPAWNYLSTGRLFDAYWYIPFIMIVFALSPLFLNYLTLPRRARLAALGGALLIAMLIHRPVHNIAIVQAVVYYLPVYLLGMCVSLDRAAVIKHLTGKEWVIALMMLALSLEQVMLYPEYANMHKPALVWAGLDINLVQKMLGCLFFYVFLNRFEYRNWPWLKTLAAASFAVYFLHPVLILAVKKSGLTDLPLFHQLPGIVMWGGWTVVIGAGAFLIAAAIRRTFPRRSRQLIGW